jgi:hypothetical protein
MLSEYTEFVTNGMHVRHDAEARFIVKSGRRTLEDRTIPVRIIGGAFTTAGIMYNAAAMSGGVRWADPTTGLPMERPKISVKVRPQDILTDGQECDCKECHGN